MVPKMGTALDPFYKCLSQKDTFHLSVEMEYGGFLQSALIQVSVEGKTIQGLELNRLLGQAIKQAHTHTHKWGATKSNQCGPCDLVPPLGQVWHASARKHFFVPKHVSNKLTRVQLALTLRAGSPTMLTSGIASARLLGNFVDTFSKMAAVS